MTGTKEVLVIRDDFRELGGAVAKEQLLTEVLARASQNLPGLAANFARLEDAVEKRLPRTAKEAGELVLQDIGCLSYGLNDHEQRGKDAVVLAATVNFLVRSTRE